MIRPFRPLGLLVLALVALIAGPASTHGQEPDDPPADAPAAKAKVKAVRKRRDPAGTYKGRRIADVMSYLGADWLIRDTRVDEEQPDRMLDALKLKAGDVVADVGAGIGYHSLKMAERVGSKGVVYATDVQPQMIRMLEENARQAGVMNVRPVLCSQTDTKLPDGRIDLILMVDVYHECTQPEAVLKGLKRALKPGGRLVLVEFRGEDPEVPIKPEHKMTLRQVRREVEPQGLVFKESLEFLPWQHVIIFEKPAEDGDAPAKP